jgi:hypothetical protein
MVEVFGIDSEARCSGSIESTVSTTTGALRVTGHVAGLGVSRFAKTDVIFTDASGRIAGLGRTLMEDDDRGRERFLGYAEAKSATLVAWRVEPNGLACRLEL